MTEAAPENLPSPELSPEQLAELEAIVEMSELILADPDQLVSDEDQPDFNIGPAPVTPYHTEVDEDRMYWRESEWPQVAALMAERFGIALETVLEAQPEAGNVVLAERAEGPVTLLLGITRTSDQVEVGQVPFTLAVTTETIGWEPR